jgi:hypothetical protein
MSRPLAHYMLHARLGKRLDCLAQELPTDVLMTNISIQRTAFSIGIVSSLEIIVSQRSDYFFKQDLAKMSTIAIDTDYTFLDRTQKQSREY